jgi:hypothetical protein
VPGAEAVVGDSSVEGSLLREVLLVEHRCDEVLLRGSFVGENLKVVEEDSSLLRKLLRREVLWYKSLEEAVVVVGDNSAAGGCLVRSSLEASSLACTDGVSALEVLYVEKDSSK